MVNVLSLFDGISACRLALQRAGIEVNTCYRAEIDKYANAVAQGNFPDSINLGDVNGWEDWTLDWSSIDLVTAGFPCQAWSTAGYQLGDKDPRGALFWTMLNIISKVLASNPNAKFVIENVKMKCEFEEYITKHTESALKYVEKTLINSALLSAQNRERYYWTNFKVYQPANLGATLDDILESGFAIKPKSQTILATIYKENAKSMLKRNKFGLLVKLNDDEPTLLNVRKLSTVERGRLQTFPDNWAERFVSSTQAYKCYGNAWTVDVISHILKCAFP